MKKESERMLASQGEQREGQGSSVCPICGKDSPHYHPPEAVTEHYSRVKAITDQHILCVRLADALRGMPFPPHMPDEAGNAMRDALDEFDEKSAAYLQAALSAPPLAESVEACATEICEFFDDPGYFTVTSVADIIRRRMQQGE